jgi:glycerol-3-phosphate cytidylyltransferase
VVSDELSRIAKGKSPVIPLAERLEIVSSIRYVDEAVEENAPTKLEMWERLRFDVIIKGDDWRGTDKGNKLERDFAAVGVQVFYLPYTVHTSSTMLRQALNIELGRLASSS